MLKTLAAKHGSTVTKMARKYKAKIATPHGPRTCFEATVERAGRKPLVARFGGIPLKRQNKAVLTDRLPVPPTRRKELIQGSGHGGASGASTRTGWKSTRSAKLADLTRSRDSRSPVGAPHGPDAQEDPHRLHPLPPGHPPRAPNRRTRRSHWRASCWETSPRGSDRGSLEKDPPRRAPRQRPTGVPRCLLSARAPPGPTRTGLAARGFRACTAVSHYPASLFADGAGSLAL